MRTRRSAAASAAGDSPGPRRRACSGDPVGHVQRPDRLGRRVGRQRPRLEPGGAQRVEVAGPARGPGDREEQDLAHADPHGAPVVRVDARRVEHERLDAEGAGRAGDGAEVLRVVEPLEHGDAPGAGDAVGDRRAAAGGRRRRPRRGGGRSRRSPPAPAADATYTGASRPSRRPARRARACGVTRTERTRWPDSSSRSIAVTPSATNSSSRSRRRRAAGIGQLEVVGEAGIGGVVDGTGHGRQSDRA